MESSGPSGKLPQRNKQSWGEAIGTIIALLTLTLPLLVTAHYSQDVELETSRQTSYPPIEMRD